MEKNKIEQAKELLEKEGFKVTSPNEISHEGWLDVSDVLDGYEAEINVHDKNMSWDDLGLSSREDELLTAEQCIKLANSKYAKILKMDGSSSRDDFFIKQPFDLSRKNGYVASFYAGSNYANLGCGGGSDDSSSYRGVRFVRKISRSKK